MSGTPEIPGWYINFQAAVIKQLPRPGEIDQFTAEGWTKNQEFLKSNLRQRLAPEKPVKKTPTFKHLYEFNIHKDGVSTEILLKRMDGLKVVAYAQDIMESPNFAIGPMEDVIIRVYSAEALGVAGWPNKDFFEKYTGGSYLKKIGLSLCLPDDAPYLILAHDKQPKGESIEVAHEPIIERCKAAVLSLDYATFVDRSLSVTTMEYVFSENTLIAVRVIPKSNKAS